MTGSLDQRHCTPCRGGVEPLGEAAAKALLSDLPAWQLADDAKRIRRDFSFKNFAQSLAFVNEVGAIAEAEGHHPDITFGWGYAAIVLQTHKIDGLHENDFILAAKIDALARPG
jgi:4a-hydroxytetrahydrobiopterin dehydratase